MQCIMLLPARTWRSREGARVVIIVIAAEVVEGATLLPMVCTVCVSPWQGRPRGRCELRVLLSLPSMGTRAAVQRWLCSLTPLVLPIHVGLPGVTPFPVLTSGGGAAIGAAGRFACRHARLW